MSNMNLLLLLQTGFLQTAGWVYLNCCSTPSTMVRQSRHWKVPCTSSGWTGCVLTTCPVFLVRDLILIVVSSLT